MRKLLITCSIFSSYLASAAVAQVFPLTSPSDGKQLRLKEFAQRAAQVPIMNSPGIALPNQGGDAPESEPSGNTVISDVLGRAKSINIFAGLTRNVDNVLDRLGNNSQNTTVLAPLNAEISKLPRKPWEDPEDYATFGSNAYDGTAGEIRAHKNLRRFVESHVVPQSPWQEGSKATAMGGNEVWFESKDGKKVVSTTVSGIDNILIGLLDTTRQHRGYKYRR